jgi:hypothetical protein
MAEQKPKSESRCNLSGRPFDNIQNFRDVGISINTFCGSKYIFLPNFGIYSMFMFIWTNSRDYYL